MYPQCHPRLLFDFCPIVLMLFEKSVSTKWGHFFHVMKSHEKGNITNLPQRKPWWNAILPSLLESPFRKIFTFICDDFLKRKNLLQQTHPGQIIKPQIPKLLSFKKAFVFSRGKVPPTILGGYSQLRVFQPKTSKAEPETLRADMLLDERRSRFVAAVVFCGEKVGWLSDPFKGLTDLQLRNQKVTLHLLVEIVVCGRLPFFYFFFRKRGGSKLKLSRTGVFPLCRYVCPYIFADMIFVNKW